MVFLTVKDYTKAEEAFNLGMNYFGHHDEQLSITNLFLLVGLQLNDRDEECLQGLETIKVSDTLLLPPPPKQVLPLKDLQCVSIRHQVKESLEDGKASFARNEYSAAVKYAFLCHIVIVITTDMMIEDSLYNLPLPLLYNIFHRFFSAAIDNNPHNHILYAYRAISYLGVGTLEQGSLSFFFVGFVGCSNVLMDLPPTA